MADYAILWQRGARHKLLAYFRDWDRAGRLYLADAASCPRDRRGELFPVYKSIHKDRVVFNRIPQNFWERPLERFSATTPVGAELVELEIPPGSSARLFSEDLADFYPSFVASPQRAVTNAVAYR